MIPGGKYNNNTEEDNNIDSTEQAEKNLEKEKNNAENTETNKKSENNKETTSVEEKENNQKNKGNIGIEEGKEKSKILNPKELNPFNQLSSFMKVASGEKGLFETMGNISPRLMDNKVGNALKAFEDKGGMQKLHSGFNQIRDTFYDGPAPGDWKETNKRMEKNQKEKEEQTKFNVCNQYKEEFTQKFFLEYKDQYKDNKNYNDKRLMDMAKQKADSKLKSLTDTYVPLGVTDANVMMELEQDRKDYGYTPGQAVNQMTAFTKFNNNDKNLEKVNIENKADIHTVTDAIPNAKDYYNNGYKNTKDMSTVYAIEKKLNVSPDYAMQIDKALRKKGGKINYTGENNDIKDIVKQINKQYEK